MFTISEDTSFSLKKREESRQNCSFFPNQISLGSFNPLSTIIEVEAFHTKAVIDAQAQGDLMPVRMDLQVLAHELTHWFDFFGTVWGRSYLTKICRAYVALESKLESDFPRIIDLFDFQRRVLIPSYYKYASPPIEPHDLSRPWSIDYTAGYEIAPNGDMNMSAPIVFARFGENPSRNNFARQPISVGTLLEVRAIASELTTGMDAIVTHKNEDEVRVEVALMNTEMMNMAYSHELIEYNVASHLLSVRSNTRELTLTSRLASRLAFIALNLQKDDFSRLKLPSTFHPLKGMHKAFKKNMDRGYAFACMVFNGGEFGAGDEDNFIKQCLANSNLDTEGTILERAAETLNTLPQVSRVDEVAKHFIKMCEGSGLYLSKLIEQRDYSLSLDFILDNPDLCPPFIDSEINVVELSEGSAAMYKVNELHESALELSFYTGNLLSGCRGID